MPRNFYRPGHMLVCRDFTKVDLEKVELPSNHPFAMKKQVLSVLALSQVLLLSLPACHLFLLL